MNKIDQSLGWVSQAVLAGRNLQSHHQSQSKHNALNISVLALLVTSFVGMMFLSKVLPGYAYLPLASFSFGLLYFVSFILVVHEAAHQMFVISKNPKRKKMTFWINRLAGLAVCVPFGVSYLQHWEVGHRVHHVHPMEADDAQGCVSSTGKELFKECAKILFFPGFLQTMGFLSAAGNEYYCPQVKKYKHKIWTMTAGALYWAGMAAITLTYFDWKVLVAMLAGTSILGIFNVVKQAMEHGGELSRQPSRALRSRSSFFALRHVLMPLNISLHFEHHLDFSVPWYNLKKYHDQILPIVPKEFHDSVFNHEVWSQIMGKKPVVAPSTI